MIAKTIRIGLVVAAVCTVFDGPACADELEAGYEAHKAKALAKHARAISQLGSGAALKPFTERVRLVDDVAILLARRMTSTKTEVLNEVLQDIFESEGSVIADDAPKILVTPVDIYGEYVDFFQEGVQAPDIAPEGLTLLKQYYTDVIQAAGKFVFQRGKVAVAVNPKVADEVVQLCAVLPLMEISESQWSKRNVMSLPEHMRSPESLKALEELAVQIRRPMTARQFAEVSSGEAWGAARIQKYFVSSAADRRKRHQYLPATSYLKVAIEQAEGNKDLRASAGEMFIQLAELYEEMAHPNLAARTLAEMMEKHPTHKDWGKAAMLRLKYLYGGGALDELAADGTKYAADKRAEGFAMQIRYMLWVTHRRLGQGELASKIQEKFVKNYPQSTLCADMYFASAMTALAEGNYTEAGRLLEVIEYRYPKAPIAAKVKQIQERLKGLSKG